MVFSSVIFLFLFLPLTLLLYFLFRKKRENGILLLASLMFYFWGEGQYINIMLLSILLNYSVGFLLTKYRSFGLLSIGVTANILVLIYYKYFNFIQQNLNHLFYENYSVGLDSVHLPIGISFFTFQSVSYIVDVYRKETSAQKNILNLALYVSLFPQLIAGPIVRYSHIAKEIDIRKESIFDFGIGVKRFIIGLSKKVLIANNVAGVADGIFSIPTSSLTTPLAWLGILAYTLQIYFDFSGYSDMAIGLGRMFGFHFEENFNFPYASLSIKDFWRKWHISLSTWFRDYVYIPLGGNKISGGRTYLNLLIVFIVTGLWHGANWTFVIWGLFHGFFLLLERILLENWLKRLPSLIRYVYTILIVMIAWIFFRSDTLSSAISFIQKLFGYKQSIDGIYYIGMYLNNLSLFAIIIGCFLSLPVNRFLLTFVPRRKKRIEKSAVSYFRLFSSLGLLVCFILCIVSLSSDTYNPFIYYRF